MRPDRGMQAVIGGMIMKSVRRKEEDYFFEYDNVYNMEPDELRAESASDTSVWYSWQVDNPEKISRSTIEVVLLLFFCIGKLSTITLKRFFQELKN